MENIELLIILSLLLGLSNWFIYYQNNKNPKYNFDDNILDKLNTHILELKKNNNILEKELELKENILSQNIMLPERKYMINMQPEKNHMINIPEKNHMINIHEKNNMINIPTRGYPDDYQLIGILFQDNLEIVYNLYGRQTYPGSNLYEYYIHAVINNNNIKIPLNINKEIFDNQEIDILNLNHKNTKFKVKLYPYNLPRYIP